MIFYTISIILIKMTPDSLPWNEVLDTVIEKTKSYELYVEPVKRSNFETNYRYFYTYCQGKSIEDIRIWLLEDVAQYIQENRSIIEYQQLDCIVDILLFPMRISGISKQVFLQHTSKFV